MRKNYEAPKADVVIFEGVFTAAMYASGGGDNNSNSDTVSETAGASLGEE